LKSERWGSPLVQEEYRGEKAFDRKHDDDSEDIFVSASHFSENHSISNLTSSWKCDPVSLELLTHYGID
jgi:hypothetical protein